MNTYFYYFFFLLNRPLDRENRFWILLFLIFFFFAVSFLKAEKTPIDSAGLIHIPEGTMAEGDFFTAVYSESLNADPLAKGPSPLQGPNGAKPLEGCLSVVRLELLSGLKELDAPGYLAFACTESAGNSLVYGWFDKEWKPMPFQRDEKGRPEFSFRELTTYALFPTEIVPSPPSVM